MKYIARALASALAASGALTACTADVVESKGAHLGSAEEALKVTDLTFEVNSAVPDEHCALPESLRVQFGSGNQIRLLTQDNLLALCTVAAAASTSQASDHAQMNVDTLKDRFGLASADSSTTVEQVTANDRYDDAIDGGIARPQASLSLTIDPLLLPDVQEWSGPDTGSLTSAHRVLYAVPHGSIELGTAEQVKAAIIDAPGGQHAWEAVWMALLRQTSVAAGFNQFHITSTDLSGLSFRQLGAELAHGFDYAVSFHGFSSDPNNRDVIVGGGIEPSFRAGVAEIIDDELNPPGQNPTFEVEAAASGDSLAGAGVANFVNRAVDKDTQDLVAGRGLQIEQSLTLRNDTAKANALAASVRSVFDCLIDPSDAGLGIFLGSGGSLTSGGLPAGYENNGACPRFIAEFQSDVVSLTNIDPGADACVVGGRLHADIYRLRADGTWQRIGGGHRTGVLHYQVCMWDEENDYVPPARADLSPGKFRIVIRAKDADNNSMTASVTVSS